MSCISRRTGLLRGEMTCNFFLFWQWGLVVVECGGSIIRRGLSGWARLGSG